MAAYAALVSVMQIMDQIQRHPHPPISIDEEQVESLTENVTFLQEFLEGYTPHRSYTSEADPLESRIAEAAYAAEDVIEFYIVDQIQARSTDEAESISSTEFYQGLQKVIEEMDLIKVEVMEMKERKKMEGVQIIKTLSKTDAAGSFRSSSSTAQKVTTMVGLDDVLYEMLDKITRGERARQIIPIVGMGGLGKTTLARNIYAHQLVKEHFDICAWSRISQVHKAKNILREILGQVGLDNGRDLSEYELGEQLYKYLIGRRYLIVMDDMWTVEAWDVVGSFLPDNENGSRVLVTTRLSNLASMFNYSDGLDMKFLDKASSRELFSKTVFGDQMCPSELEDIGEEIVEGCRGLPLSIVVVGGLLSKSDPTRENWEVVEENLSSVVNAEEDGSCLQSLYMSYNNLPIHLKPCFLYLGVFPEDQEIPVYVLIAQMVAEGFIQPIEGKSLEEATQEYVEELVGRNLVLVDERDNCGMLSSCKIHDMLRDLALREAEKDKFVCALMQSRDISQGIISGQRRITNSLKEENTVVLESMEAAAASSLVRSLLGRFRAQIFSLPRFRLLRVCLPEERNNIECYEEIFNRLFNLRFVLVYADDHPLPKISSCMWNLQTLILLDVEEDYVLDIWKMPLLRLVVTTPVLRLPNPPPPTLGGDEVVLENLHTLSVVRNLNLGEVVIKRIPNITKLNLFYIEEEEEEEEEEDYCLNNLHRLNKLQDLCLACFRSDFRSTREFSLPHSLKELTLHGTQLPWGEMASKIGCLPVLQVLVLDEDSFIGSEWETVEGQFSSLKILEIEKCNDLECWITDNTHFPRLEHLVLRLLDSLSEIPSSIGDIPTLRSIKSKGCSKSAAESARRIQEEQEECGNQIQVLEE